MQPRRVIDRWDRNTYGYLAEHVRRGTPIMMMLGPFMFSLDTAAPRAVRRDTQYRWPEQDRIGRPPALQYTGPGSDRIELSGVIYPQYKGGFGQMAAMREMALIGRPMILLDGRGIVYGKWAITRISDTGTVYLKTGAPAKQRFRVSLEACGGDDKKALLDYAKQVIQ